MAERSGTVYGPARMWLVVFEGEDPVSFVEITGDEFTIGRDETCGLVLDDEKVSRYHAKITPGVGPFRMLRDLGSTNGTLVDGRRVTKGLGFTAPDERLAELSGGEVIQFGDTRVLATLKDPAKVLPSEGGPPEP
jgi:pSer/pThr/pTyr-binding forkhead associated (FHA) protein